MKWFSLLGIYYDITLLFIFRITYYFLRLLRTNQINRFKRKNQIYSKKLWFFQLCCEMKTCSLCCCQLASPYCGHWYWSSGGFRTNSLLTCTLTWGKEFSVGLSDSRRQLDLSYLVSSVWVHWHSNDVIISVCSLKYILLLNSDLVCQTMSSPGCAVSSEHFQQCFIVSSMMWHLGMFFK